MSIKPAASLVDVTFNKAQVDFARTQDLLKEWMSGTSNKYPGAAKSQIELEQEEKGIFTIEPELAGLGVAPQSLSKDDFVRLDPLSQSDNASTALLRERLMGKKRDNQSSRITRPTIALHGVQPGFVPLRAVSTKQDHDTAQSGSRSNRGTSNVQTIDVVSDDDEDDVGRSGLGEKPGISRVAKLSGHSKRGSAVRPINEPVDDPVKLKDIPFAIHEGHEAVHDTIPSKVASNLERTVGTVSKRKTMSYLDELLAQKKTKKNKKKKKKGKKSKGATT